MTSPQYGDTDPAHVQPVKDICLEMEVPFIDYMVDECFQKAAYFNDRAHLNVEGARIFTRRVIRDGTIQKLLDI